MAPMMEDNKESINLFPNYENIPMRYTEIFFSCKKLKISPGKK